MLGFDSLDASHSWDGIISYSGWAWILSMDTPPWLLRSNWTTQLGYLEPEYLDRLPVLENRPIHL